MKNVNTSDVTACISCNMKKINTTLFHGFGTTYNNLNQLPDSSRFTTRERSLVKCNNVHVYAYRYEKCVAFFEMFDSYVHSHIIFYSFDAIIWGIFKHACILIRVVESKLLNHPTRQLRQDSKQSGKSETSKRTRKKYKTFYKFYFDLEPKFLYMWQSNLYLAHSYKLCHNLIPK